MRRLLGALLLGTLVPAVWAHGTAATRALSFAVGQGRVEVTLVVEHRGPRARELRERADRNQDGRLDGRERRELGKLLGSIETARLEVRLGGKPLSWGTPVATSGVLVDDSPLGLKVRARMNARGRVSLEVNDGAPLAIAVLGGGQAQVGEVRPGQPFSAEIAVKR